MHVVDVSLILSERLTRNSIIVCVNATATEDSSKWLTNRNTQETTEARYPNATWAVVARAHVSLEHSSKLRKLLIFSPTFVQLGVAFKTFLTPSRILTFNESVPLRMT